MLRDMLTDYSIVTPENPLAKARHFRLVHDHATGHLITCFGEVVRISGRLVQVQDPVFDAIVRENFSVGPR